MELIKGIIEKVTEANFDESGYVLFNKDISDAIEKGILRNGEEHYFKFGRREERKQFNSSKLKAVGDLRTTKMEKLVGRLRLDLEYEQIPNGKLNFLSDDLKSIFDITPTNNVSSLGYDSKLISLLENRYSEGLVLDCGAGLRQDYYSNVINFEIVNYFSTDVLGVGEVLPFRDETFDMVVSVAVLEHVKDPFRCAKEIMRVLKKGGTLFSAIPFLQPYHGYPHHYYNMTHQGHENLYKDYLDEYGLEVIDSLKPIHALSWFLNRYYQGLPRLQQVKFGSMRIRDFLGASPDKMLQNGIVHKLDLDTNKHLASGTLIIGTKK